MNKVYNNGRLKINRVDSLKEQSKKDLGSIIGNSLLSGIFTLGAICSYISNGSLPLVIGYLILDGIFGYGIVTSIKDKINDDKEIRELEQANIR